MWRRESRLPLDSFSSCSVKQWINGTRFYKERSRLVNDFHDLGFDRLCRWFHSENSLPIN